MLKNKKQKGFTLLYAVLVSSIVLSASLSIINIALKQHKLAALSRESKIAFYAANTGADCALYWDGHSRAVTKVIENDALISIFPTTGGYDDPSRTSDDTNQAARIDSDNEIDDAINCLGSDIVQSNDFYGQDINNDPDGPIEITYDFDINSDHGNINADGKDPTWIANRILDNSDLQDEFCLDSNLTNNQDYRTWIFQIIIPDNNGLYSKDNACAIVSVCKNSNPGVGGNGGYSTIYTAKGYNTCDITKENVVERGIRLLSS